MPQGARAAEGQVANRAQVVFELAGYTALDGPMAGIMDSRSHFIGNQSFLDDEKLDGEDADIGERIHHPVQINAGTAIEARICKRGNAVAQNTAAVAVG